MSVVVLGPSGSIFPMSKSSVPVLLMASSSSPGVIVEPAEVVVGTGKVVSIGEGVVSEVSSLGLVLTSAGCVLSGIDSDIDEVFRSARPNNTW